MEIESVGRSLAIVMIGVVAGWLLTGLVMLIRDGIRFRRGMRAQIEANQREIDLTLARAKHQQAELDGMLAAVRDSQGAQFPLAAPVIQRARTTSVWPQLSAWKGCAKAADGNHLAVINPNDFEVRCGICGETARADGSL